MAPAAPATGRMAGEEAELAAKGQVTQAHMGCPGPDCGSCEMGVEWGEPTKQGFDELSCNYMNCFCVMRAQGKIALSCL